MAKNKITFEQAKQRFIDQGRQDIELCDEGFISWTKKAKFFDKIVNDYFWAQPCNVFNRKSVHPDRRSEKLKTTNMEKYGCEHNLQNKIIKEKSKNTNLKRYGCENPFGNKDIQEQIKKTNIEKYGFDNIFKNPIERQKIKKTIKERFGVEHVTQNVEIKNKIKATNLKKYGKENIFELDSFKEKSKKTNLDRYGVENPSQNVKVKQKLKDTMKQKYGFTSFSKLNAKKIDETNESIKDWLDKQSEPKPSYVTVMRNIRNTEDQSLEHLQEMIVGHKENKTQLEILGEKLFNTEHFNKNISVLNRNYRPDFKLSEIVYVNVDGLYWHSDKEKDKKYHFEMRKEYEKNGLRIFQFYSNEIKNKPNVIKSIVDNNLGLIKNKIYARKCEIKIVPHSEAIIFINNNHLMGSTTAKHLGLYHNNELVSLLSYKEKKNICKIERFCSKTNFSIVGGFSKLLKYLECNLLKPSTTEIHNWVDLRYGTGNHLIQKDFKLIKETLGWKWTDGVSTFNRLKCRANMDERKLTENQHAEELKWYRIHDAGQRLFVKKLNK